MIDIMQFDKRSKAILMGLYLSRFDKQALESFGFTSFKQAYNVLGYSIGFIPKSIQNYRDEFDPLFPNGRKGWRNRNIRDYCREFYDLTQNWSFDLFYSVIRSFIDKETIIDETFEPILTNRDVIVNRLITGKAAEEYFIMNYKNIECFQNYNLTDTTNWGCGFDFKLSLDIERYYIEVKGLNGQSGGILMTEKEYTVAKQFKDKYCLFIVSNFRDKPKHNMYFNPTECSNIDFRRREQQITQVSYSASFL